MYLSRILTHGYKAAGDNLLSCELPGRFAVLAGANAAGKSTTIDSIILSHRDVFPYMPRPSSSALVRGVASPTIDIEYSVSDDPHSPLGNLLQAEGRTPRWTTGLSSSMGRVHTNASDWQTSGILPVLFLAPTRNPSFDLGGREARLIVELLKAEALRSRGDKSLRELRGRLGGLIRSIVTQWPVAGAEHRVGDHLAELTDGVAGRVPYLATTSIDDNFLARVFEFLIGAVEADRDDAYRLESEGLGYANLLQLAVVLAAIPDLTREPDDDDDDESEDDDDAPEVDSSEFNPDELADLDDEQRRELMRQAEESRQLDDESFFAGNFHAVVILEEPEAHLHTQLQWGLISYLKEVVEARPEVQLIITTHSDQIVSACEPDDLVVFTRSDGAPAARTVKKFNLPRRHRSLAERHLDTTRSAGMFADRVVFVEGPTDAVVLRAFGRVWAGDDRLRRRFIDALTIVVVGSRVGEWMPNLLVHADAEIATKVAVLADSDGKLEPGWVGRRRSDRFEMFRSEPTLEPAIVDGNEDLIDYAFRQMFKSPDKAPVPWGDDGPTPESLAVYFAGMGRSRKADFAHRIADELEADDWPFVAIPDHFDRLFEFVWDGFGQLRRPDDDDDDDDDGDGSAADGT